MLIAQLSDLHVVAPGRLLYREIDTAGALALAVARINGLAPQPDLVVITGDLVDRGRDEEYARLRELLAALSPPWRLLPGNHDDRSALRRAFPAQSFPATGRCSQRLDAGELTLLLLDATVPGADGGVIDDECIDWLEAHCPPSATMLFLHHPPFATGIAGMDAIGLAGGERLGAWLAGHPNVLGLSCGHVHRAVFTTFAGIAATIAPSPAHQIALDLAGNPASLAWTMEPGGMLLHRYAAGRLISHLLPVATAAVRPYG